MSIRRLIPLRIALAIMLAACAGPAPTVVAPTMTNVPTRAATSAPAATAIPTVAATRIIASTPTKVPTAAPSATPATATVAATTPITATGRIVYMAGAPDIPDTHEEIYMINPDGTGQIRLTNNLVSDAGPALSWDGKRIAFVSDRNGNDDIYGMPAPAPGSTATPDSSQVTRLTDSPGSDYAPEWSVDGKQIVFTSDRDGNPQIYVMNADGSGQTRLTRNTATDDNPSWSPDGKQIVFDSNRSGNTEIYVMNSDGTGVKQLTKNTVPSAGPHWSPDGKRIAFVRNRDNDGTGQVYVMQADGSRPINLSNSSTNDFTVCWSPDGAWLAFSRDLQGIFVMRADGSDQTALTHNPSDWDITPNWGR